MKLHQLSPLGRRPVALAPVISLLLVMLLIATSARGDTIRSNKPDGTVQVFNDVTLMSVGRDPSSSRPVFMVRFSDGQTYPVLIDQVVELQLGGNGEGRDVDLTVGDLFGGGQNFPGSHLFRFYRPPSYPNGGFVATEPGAGPDQKFFIPAESVVSITSTGVPPPSAPGDSFGGAGNSGGAPFGNPDSGSTFGADDGTFGADSSMNGDDWADDSSYDEDSSYGSRHQMPGWLMPSCYFIIAIFAVCQIIVLLAMFSEGDTTMALLGIFICGAIIFFWGWLKWRSPIKIWVMLTWTLSPVLLVLLIFLAVFAG